MIRYRWKGLTPLLDAAYYCLPGSRPLAGRGPWVWTHEATYTVATLQDEVGDCAWLPWRRGLGDYEVSIADPLPAWDIDRWRGGKEGVEIHLTAGPVVVRPLSFEGRSVDWDGVLGMPSSEYGKQCVSILERIANGEEILYSDRDLIALCRRSLMECMEIPAELIHGYGFLSEDDMLTIMGVIADHPKP